MYFNKRLSTDARMIRQFTSHSWSNTQVLVFASILATLAALLQFAGNWLPGIGLLISTFSTIPILLGVIISYRYGLYVYVIATLLLLLLEPGEFFMFTFTTGLLGLGIGWSMLVLQRRWMIILLNGSSLSIGISIPLYIIGFPALGPLLTSFELRGLLIIFTFSVFYSWIWLELSFMILRKLRRTLLSISSK